MTVTPPIQLTHAQIQTAHASNQMAGTSLQATRRPLCLIADGLTNPSNIGGLFRLADALGVSHLHLLATQVQPPNPKIRRAARMTEKSVPWSFWADAETLIAHLKSQDYYFVGLEITHQSQDLAQAKIPHNTPIACIVGAEKTGICQTVLNHTDLTLHIPMCGQNSSMNVVTAAAIGLYALGHLLN